MRQAPYIHTVTLMFLIAMLVGVCELCKNPEQTYAVEPFMLMNVAYNVGLDALRLIPQSVSLSSPFQFSAQVNQHVIVSVSGA